MIGYVLLSAAILLGGLLVVMMVRTARFTKEDTPPPPPVVPEERVPTQEVADHLSGALQFATVSHADPEQVDWTQFAAFHEYLEKTYPKVHSTMEKEVVGDYNLVFRWRGTAPEAKPIAFLGHIDVVPPAEGDEWVHPPFSGHDDGAYIWGRGAIDMKHQIILILEACERLIGEGHTPRQDIYLCFGQNEEVGNLPEGTGADLIAATLRERGVRFDCVIDEGGTIASGKLLGIRRPVCVVGVAEKGFVTFHLTAASKGGHSAHPPRSTALGRICRAAARVEAHPQKPRLVAPVRSVFLAIAPYMKPYFLRFLVANLWLLEGLFARVVSRSSLMRAMVMTTFAVTQAEGSPQDNLLPQNPWIGVNCRVLPDETIDDVQAYLEKVINDPEVAVTAAKRHQVRDVSPTDTNAFRLIGRLANRYYPETVLSPYIMFGGSDARNYYQICENVYRFMPVYLDRDTAEYGAHRANEKLPKNILSAGVAIFMDFILEYEGEGSV